MEERRFLLDFISWLVDYHPNASGEELEVLMEEYLKV